MKLRKVPKAKGGGWEIRWRQGDRHRSRTFRRYEDAVAFDDDLRRRRRLGTLADLDAGTELLAAFGADWWQRSARSRLAESTRKRYAEVWDRHVLPRLGDYQLRELKTGVIEDDLVTAMLAEGVGLATVRKALYVLRSCLAYAVRRELLAFNPARDVELPKQARRPVRPIPPEAVERMRATLELRDRTIISLLAYAGLRPGEALALRDDSIRDRTLLVETSISFGQEKATKTRKSRTVRLLGPLAQDLAEYRLATRKERLGTKYLFPAEGGGPWTDSMFRNWRRRSFKPAAKVAGHEHVRPYDLRHSFVSLLAEEGRTLAYTAAQAGHSVEEAARTYTHVFEEFEDAPRLAAEELIRRARAKAA